MNKKITVNMSTELYKSLEKYCENAEIDRDLVISYALENFLKYQEPTIVSLRDGYKKMAQINLEISSEFSHTDRDTNHLF